MNHRVLFEKLLIMPNICQLGLYAPTASLQRDKESPNKCPGYDAKQSDGKASVKREFYGMQSSPLLPSLPGSLWALMIGSNLRIK